MPISKELLARIELYREQTNQIVAKEVSEMQAAIEYCNRLIELETR
jgi:hypothetical protein